MTTKTTKLFNKTQLLIFLALVFASCVSVLMVLIRLQYSGVYSYFFLIWNLILAWMPFWFALGARRYQSKWPFALVWGGMWLLFFPNAPYIITDFIHIYPRHNVPVWYDALMIFAFALTGLFLGIVSLAMMHSVMTKRAGRLVGWLFVGGTLLLSSYGVYIGRFLRWNSWDLFSSPFLLLQDLVSNLSDPYLFVRTAVVTGFLTLVMGFIYLMVFLLPDLTQLEMRD